MRRASKMPVVLLGIAVLLGVGLYLAAPASAAGGSAAGATVLASDDNCSTHPNDWRDDGHCKSPSPRPSPSESSPCPSPSPSESHSHMPTPPPSHSKTPSPSPTKSHTPSASPSAGSSTPTQPPTTIPGSAGPGGNTGVELAAQRSSTSWVLIGTGVLIVAAFGFGGLYWWRRREAVHQ